MSRIGSYVSGHKRLVGSGVAIGVALAIFVAWWFQPQKLFLNTDVQEAFDEPTITATGTAATSMTLASGSWRPLEHDTTGKVRLVRQADGSVVVRFDDLDTSNGPDLRVYLSKLPPNLGWRDYGRQYVELGKLKGNRGDQNYSVPSNLQLDEFQSVVIWCVRFAVGFAVAPLA